MIARGARRPDQRAAASRQWQPTDVAECAAADAAAAAAAGVTADGAPPVGAVDPTRGATNAPLRGATATAATAAAVVVADRPPPVPTSARRPVPWPPRRDSGGHAAVAMAAAAPSVHQVVRGGRGRVGATV